jgi:ribonuclease D
MAGCCHQLCSCDLGTCLSLARDFLQAWPEMQGLAQQRTPDALAVERNLVTWKREATSDFHEYFLALSAP